MAEHVCYTAGTKWFYLGFSFLFTLNKINGSQNIAAPFLYIKNAVLWDNAV